MSNDNKNGDKTTKTGGNKTVKGGQCGGPAAARGSSGRGTKAAGPVRALFP